MALVLEQQFPLGRFHATRWNQNPFEDPYGEWPPSPWRLLRALAARWFQYSRETGDRDEQLRDALLQALARSLPAFCLPELSWRGLALRQYQPTALEDQHQYKKDPKTKKQVLDYKYKEVGRTLVADHYRVLSSDEPIYWYWQDLSLTDSQTELLDRLLERTLYFGRAESFCWLRRIDSLPDGVRPNTILQEKNAGGMGPVLVPRPQVALNFGALLAFTDSSELKGRSIPPGTIWYYAAIPQRPVVTRTVKPTPRFPDSLNCIQFAVGGRVYPPLAQWIKVTERFRGRVLKHLSAQITGNPRSHYGSLTPEQQNELALISGKDGGGNPLLGHQHAFFLLWPNGNGVPDRLVIWRRQPFTPQEIQALLATSEHPISWASGAPDWSVRLVPLPFETSPPLGLLFEARVWQSATPFVPPTGRRRFRKNGRVRIGESPQQMLIKLLQTEGKPPPSKVTPFNVQEETSWVNLHKTRQRRQLRTEARTPWVRPGYWLRVEFNEPVPGPLILGDSCHFGLGLFVPTVS